MNKEYHGIREKIKNNEYAMTEIEKANEVYPSVGELAFKEDLINFIGNTYKEDPDDLNSDQVSIVCIRAWENYGSEGLLKVLDMAIQMAEFAVEIMDSHALMELTQKPLIK